MSIGWSLLVTIGVVACLLERPDVDLKKSTNEISHDDIISILRHDSQHQCAILLRVLVHESLAQLDRQLGRTQADVFAKRSSGESIEQTEHVVQQ